jgi:hypothetical protein
MLPTAAIQNHPDRPLADAVFHGKLSLADSWTRAMRRHVSTTNVENGSNSEFRGSIGFAFLGRFWPERAVMRLAAWLSAFVAHVTVVIRRRAKEQMVWSNAIPSVALMANHEAERDGSDMDFVRKAMHSELLVSQPKIPVTLVAFCSGPQPAGISLSHSRPEPDRLHGSHYDPRTGQIFLQHDSTLYQRYHEEGHKELHVKHPSIFRLLYDLRRYVLVGYLATLFLEIDADRRARRVMHRLGVWTSEAEKEARSNLMSYFKRKEIKTWPALSNQP